MTGRTNSSVGGGQIKSLNNSCVVWLPLNGNINNYGNSDLTFWPAHPSIVSQEGGNIYPGCYYNLSSSGGGLVSNKAITLGNNQSFFTWMKFISLTSASNLGCSAGGQHRYTTNTGMGLNIKYVSATTGYLTVSTGTGSDRTFNAYCGKTLLTAGSWYHLGYTYDGTTIKLYVNGQLDGSYSVPNLSNPGDYITIARWAFNTTTGTPSLENNYCLVGYLQDVRIYNKALKEKEVATIYAWRPINTVRTKKVRYIKFSANGSSSNTGTHYCELEAYNEAGAIVTRGLNGAVTDGNYNSGSYTETQSITIDLKSIMDISYIKQYHYYADNRSYYYVTVEVSTDGNIWEKLFDSELMGRYTESSVGQTVICVQGP